MSDTDGSTLEHRRKRLAWRCRYRGTRELDVLLGRLVEHLDDLDEQDFDAIEALLEEPEPLLMRWLVTDELPAHAGDAMVVRRLRELVNPPNRGEGQSPGSVYRLADRAVMHVTGEDALKFLQGQLTCDLREVTPTQFRLAAWCSPKGRALIVYRVYRLPGGDFLLSYPAELEATAKRLAMFTMRAKAKVNVSSDWRAFGISGSSSAAGAVQTSAAWPVPGDEPGSANTHGDDTCAARLPGDSGRVEVLTRDAAMQTALDADARDDDTDWRLATIRDGEPVVTADTADQFVPQMLNLELLGGISFDKGCYVGQEVVARTQHLGKIKRRMFRLVTDSAPPAPGTSMRRKDADQAIGGVVSSATLATGGAELLAVLRTEAVTDGDALVAGDVDVRPA